MRTPVKRAILLLLLPLFAVSACDRRPTPPNVIPPNMAAKAEVEGLAVTGPATTQKTP
jgi:hypothetical protein